MGHVILDASWEPKLHLWFSVRGMEWTYILIDDGDLKNGISLAASHMKSACVPRSTNHTSGVESALWALA